MDKKELEIKVEHETKICLKCYTIIINDQCLCSTCGENVKENNNV